MKWFRSNIRHGVRLAIFALLVQFVLSFGHSHGSANAAPLPQASLQGAGTDATATINREAAQKSSPTDHQRDPQKDDNCAICAVVAMASTVVFSTPPLLLLPEAIEFLQFATDAEFAHLKSSGTAFQPRAPPAS